MVEDMAQHFPATSLEVEEQHSPLELDGGVKALHDSWPLHQANITARLAIFQKMPQCLWHIPLWAAGTRLLLNIRHCISFWDPKENLANLAYPNAMDKHSTKPLPKAHLKLVPKTQDILTAQTQQRVLCRTMCSQRIISSIREYTWRDLCYYQIKTVKES